MTYIHRASAAGLPAVPLNEKRYTIQPAALDSWPFRASVAPSRNWTAQYSYSRVMHPEAAEPGNEKRQTASFEYNAAVLGGQLGYVARLGT